jgi:hypothetical protein
VESRAPSGLFPSGPVRPSFREPHPARTSAIWAGAGVAVAWLVLIGLLGTSAWSYAWLTIAGSVASGLAALGLARYGDRGVAAGVAVGTALGLAAAMALVVQRWATTGWPLW